MDGPPDRVVILVVEDDPLARELLQNVLTDEGYHVMAAATGEQALTTLGTVWPALITLDLDLPGITGDLMLAELRRRDETRAVPVIVVSAKHPIPREVRELAQAVVPKPFDIDELLTVIRDFVPPPARDTDAAS
jgi:two-component system, OmpR family, phosphate regulon response regulator PhoB